MHAFRRRMDLAEAPAEIAVGIRRRQMEVHGRADVIKRLMDGWRARRFVKDRERLLQSDNPVLAFAGNPAAGTQLLRPGQTNDAAFELLKNGEVPLIRIHDGLEVPVEQFDRVVFVTAWDPL